MKTKERVRYKRDKIRNLWVYQHLSVRDIVDRLNNDPEFVRKCGKIVSSTVQQHLRKIKDEFENSIDSDALETFNAEFMRSVEFMDGEISDITKLLEDTELKLEYRHKFMSLKHQIEKDKMTLLADRALPLSVKKYKKDRKHWTQTIKKLPDEDEVIPKIEFKVNKPREDSQA